MTEYRWALGTFFIGAIFNTFLFGLVAVQYVRYYSANLNDAVWVRATVHALLAIDITHSAIIIYIVWFYVVNNFNNPASLQVNVWAYLVTPLMETLSSVLVQLFLARRLFSLNRRRSTYIILSGLISLNLVLGVFAAVQSLATSPTWKTLILHTQRVYVAWMLLQSTIDIFLSASLAFEFRSYRTGSSRPDYVLSLLIRKAIQTGLFATILVIFSAFVTVFVRERTGHLSGMFILPLGRVYTNTLMDTLLMRSHFKEIFSEKENLTEIVSRDLQNLGYKRQ